MKVANFFWTYIPNFLVWRVFYPFLIFMRSWSSLGQNNNIYYMVTIWWVSINRVAPAAGMPDTLRHSCRVSVGTGDMATVTVAAMFWFGLGRCHCYFFWFVCFPSGLLVFLFLVSFYPISLVFDFLILCSSMSLVFVFLVF